MSFDWDYGTLRSATDVAGLYGDVTGATQLYTIPATNAQQFYGRISKFKRVIFRVRKN